MDKRIREILAGTLMGLSHEQKMARHLTNALSHKIEEVASRNTVSGSKLRKAGKMLKELQKLRIQIESAPPSTPKEQFLSEFEQVFDSYIKWSKVFEVIDNSTPEAYLNLRTRQARHSKGIVDYWKLFSYCLPRSVRETAFDQSFEELKEDYFRVKADYGHNCKAWFAFAFTLRTIWMVLDCLYVGMTSKAGRFILGALPDSWKRLWRN